MSFKKEKKLQYELHKSFFSLCETVVTRLSGPLIEKMPHLFLFFFCATAPNWGSGAAASAFKKVRVFSSFQLPEHYYSRLQAGLITN